MARFYRHGTLRARTVQSLLVQQVEIYTDGACSGNPGPGGWAALLRSGEHERELTGAEPDTTNNRMELTAALRALEALKRPCRVVLYTDSEYVQKGMSGWVENWKRNGWQRKRKGKKPAPVLNADLWRALDAVCARHEVEWRWVQAHAGVPDNERVDQLAREAIDSVRGEREP